MTCPYFRDEYVGLCTAMKRLYVPSIDEMERCCFKAYEKCWAFRDDTCSTLVTHHTILGGDSQEVGVTRSGREPHATATKVTRGLPPVDGNVDE